MAEVGAILRKQQAKLGELLSKKTHFMPTDIEGLLNVHRRLQTQPKSNDSNEKKEAEKLNKILQPVHHAMFVESNPSPVKYAAKLLDLCDDSVRLPLVKVTEPTKEIVKKALHSAKLI